ncbi:812_t:CDS:2, partial [Racocetra persica]
KEITMKVVQKKVCAIGSCIVGNEKAYNVCESKRPDGSKVNRINFEATFKNDRLYYNDTLYKYVNIWRLFQEEENKPRFNPPDRDEDSEKLNATDLIVEYYKVSVAGDLARKTQNDITSEEILVDPENLNDQN